MSKSYVITGGAGFLGQALGRALLASGDSIRILDRHAAVSPLAVHPRCRSVSVDSLAVSVLREALAGSDGCFHLATQTPVVLSAASAERVPVVLASSAAVYGHQRDEPVREDAAPAPVTAYGREKLAAESAAFSAHRAARLPVLCLRFFNIFGPGQVASRPLGGVVAKYLSALAAGLPLEVEGDGLQKRDFLFSDDAVAFLRAGMGWLQATDGYGVLNACTGRAVTILDLAAIAMRVTQRDSALQFQQSRTDDIRWSYGCPEAARSLLGVSARFDLEEKLRATYRALGAPTSSARSVR
jgi:UDP-glucose 4-epimerase